MIAGIASLMGFSTLFSTSPSNAAIAKSDFTQGDFTGWQTIGNTSINNRQAFLSTSGSTFENSTAADTTIETFLGLATGSLDNFGNGNATAGSAIKQTLIAKAGDILTFDWQFGSVDYLPYNDFSFFSISSEVSKLADVSLLKGASSGFAQTPLQTFSYKFQNSGTYTLGFGVVDVIDQAFDSQLSIDNVEVTSVPETNSAFGLLTFGVLSAVCSRLVRKKVQVI